MPSVVTVVDDYIESLLRDACIRIGLYPARTKALEWGKLLSTDECNDNAQLVKNIKKVEVKDFMRDGNLKKKNYQNLQNYIFNNESLQ